MCSKRKTWSRLHLENLLAFQHAYPGWPHSGLRALSQASGNANLPASPGVPCLQLAALHSQLAAKVDVLLASTQHMVNTTIVLASAGP